MNRYLLDTNVVSELHKHKPHGAVLEWLGSLGDGQLFLSAVTMGELQLGVEITRVQDTQKAQEIELWADDLAKSYEILSMDTECFREWARFMHKTSRLLIEDAMLAATARVHDLTVATRNETDFASFPVRVFNPFKFPRVQKP